MFRGCCPAFGKPNVVLLVIGGSTETRLMCQESERAHLRLEKAGSKSLKMNQGHTEKVTKTINHVLFLQTLPLCE